MTFTALASPGQRRPLRALLLGTAFASLSAGAGLAETLTVTGITIPVGTPFSVSVPSIEVTDGNLDEAAIRAIFAGDMTVGLPELADLDAAAVLIPEITVTTQMGPDPSTASTTTYRNLRLEEVVDGVAARAVVESTEASGAMGFAMTFGEMSLTSFDMGGMLAFYGFGPPSTSTEMKQVYADFHFAGGTFGAVPFSCTIGEMNGGGFNARPLQQRWSDLYATINELAAAETAGNTPSPAQVRQVVDFYIDILTAFTNAPMVLDGVSCSGVDEKNQPVSIAFGPIDVGGFDPGIYPEFSVNDFSLEVPGHGWAKLDNFTWKRMDFSAAIDALRHAVALDEAWFTANWRKLVPAMDGLSLAGFDADLPDEQKPGERIMASLDGFDATLGNYVNGMPADIALTLDGLVVPITPEMTDPPLAELLAYGIKEITLGLGTRLHWDEATSTIVVDQLLVDAGELGRVAVSGTLGNATAALFGDDVEAATLAAQLLTVKDLTVELQDRGIGQILLAAGARDSGQPEPSFRTAISGMAQGMTLAMLGNTEQALKAAQALGAFLGGASELKLTLTSVDPAGLGLADFARAEADPMALTGKFTVVAEASGEPVPVLERVEPVAPPAEPTDDVSIQEQKRDLKNSAPTQ